MGIKALGYVVITTQQPEAWDRFMTDVVGVMRGESSDADVALYRIDDRPFRFWIERGGSDELTAAAYEVGSASELDALRTIIAEHGRTIEEGSADEAACRGVTAFFRTTDPAGNGLEFFHGDKRDDVAFVSPAGVSGFVTGDMGMGHAVFGAPNFNETMHSMKPSVSTTPTCRASTSAMRLMIRAWALLLCMPTMAAITRWPLVKCRCRPHAASI